MLMQISEGANPITSFRRTLDVWSLTAEDFGVLSIHDTSTQPSEKTTRNLEHTV